METNNEQKRKSLMLGEFDVKVILDCLNKELSKELTDWVQFGRKTRMATNSESTISTEDSPNVASKFKAQLNTLNRKSNKSFSLWKTRNSLHYAISISHHNGEIASTGKSPTSTTIIRPRRNCIRPPFSVLARTTTIV